MYKQNNNSTVSQYPGLVWGERSRNTINHHTRQDSNQIGYRTSNLCENKYYFSLLKSKKLRKSQKCRKKHVQRG